jgi:hypothetical protein
MGQILERKQKHPKSMASSQKDLMGPGLTKASWHPWGRRKVFQELAPASGSLGARKTLGQLLEDPETPEDQETPKATGSWPQPLEAFRLVWKLPCTADPESLESWRLGI